MPENDADTHERRRITVTVKPYVFLITRDDAERSDHIEPGDVGRWGIVLNGSVLAACETEEQARALEQRFKVRCPRAVHACA
jgi:hypothetical protein